MKLVVCAIRDRAIDSFGQPMFTQAVGQAMRTFTDEVNREDKANPLFNHPEDFDLYYLTDFDTETGIFDVSTPRQIAIGKDVKRV